MNARITAELLKHKPALSDTTQGQIQRRSVATAGKADNPVIKHLDNLQEQLSGQLDSLNTVMASMQRISAIMDRMAKKQCTLNSGAAMVDPARKR